MSNKRIEKKHQSKPSSSLGAAKVITKSLTDSLTSLNAGLATVKDKRTYLQYKGQIITPSELDAIYFSNGLGKKIIDIPVNDMTREWRSLSSQELSEEDIKLFQQYELSFDTKSKFNDAQKWARLYGGSIIIFGLDGTGESYEPLDLDDIQQGSLKYMHVFDRWEVSATDINLSDPSLPNFRMPTYYLLPDQTTRVHYTRVVRFNGSQIPWRLRRMNQYWDSSILNALYNDLRNCDLIKDSTASLVLEAKKDIIKVANLQNMILAGQEDKIVDRFALADLMKSNFNMLLLDGNEDYSQITNSFAGLPQLVQEYLNILAAISDIPATRLLGLSAPGLNSTGTTELENYYTMVNSLQENDFNKQLQYTDQIMLRSLFGKMPKSFVSSWNPLWSESAKTITDRQKVDSDRHVSLLGAGVISVDEVREELKTNEVYSSLEDKAPVVTSTTE